MAHQENRNYLNSDFEMGGVGWEEALSHIKGVARPVGIVQTWEIHFLSNVQKHSARKMLATRKNDPYAKGFHTRFFRNWDNASKASYVRLRVHRLSLYIDEDILSTLLFARSSKTNEDFLLNLENGQSSYTHRS